MHKTDGLKLDNYYKYTKKVITDTIKEQIKKLKEDYENK